MLLLSVPLWLPVLWRVEKLGNFPVFQKDSRKDTPLPSIVKLSDKKAL